MKAFYLIAVIAAASPAWADTELIPRLQQSRSKRGTGQRASI